MTKQKASVGLLVALLLVAWSTVVLSGGFQGTQTTSVPRPPFIVYSVDVDPAVITAGVPISIRIVSTISAGDKPLGQTLLRESVVAQQVDAQGKLIRSLTPLYDDGTHGDSKSGDGIFSGSALVTFQQPTTMWISVSAAYKGRLLRVQSELTSLAVILRPLVLPNDTISKIANALAVNDKAEALRYINKKKRNLDRIAAMSDEDRMSLVELLRSVELFDSTEVRARFRLPGTSNVTIFTLTRDLNGSWYLFDW